MTRPSAWKRIGGVLVLCAATAIAVQAQTFNTLVNFNGNDGGNPYYVSLVQGPDGSLYGTTFDGLGNASYGTIFKLTREGALATLYNFCAQPSCADGAHPYGGLVLCTDGNLYGTTEMGGTNNAGTVFTISPKGTLATLHSFNGNDGAGPIGTLIQGIDGNIYGTTSGGGANGRGLVFKMTPEGALATLYSFCSQVNCTDGANPWAGLVQASDGDFYGTTAVGGDPSCNASQSCGTAFKITPKGALTVLHRFSSTDGAYPFAGLMQATDGKLYGTTAGGGLQSALCSGGWGGCGTVFQITTAGTLETLYSFCAQANCPDGLFPAAELIQATDGNLYGTTLEGGDNPACSNSGSCGTVFQIIPTGTLTTLHRFDLTDGDSPYGGLAEATNGSFYGTTYFGGSDFSGTVFSLSTGLGPFVRLVSPAGKAGQTGGILGQGFTGTRSVSLNGIQAQFKVMSDTFIKATVPPGATTGFVTVVTPSGTLTSNVPFRVLP